jgi:hypothetical protein
MVLHLRGVWISMAPQAKLASTNYAPSCQVSKVSDQEVAGMIEPSLKLTLLQKFKIRLGRPVYLGRRSKPGWIGTLPYYAFRCRVHGIVVDYPAGQDETLSCYVCFREKWRAESQGVEETTND